jgi:hypothetical protein
MVISLIPACQTNQTTKTIKINNEVIKIETFDDMKRSIKIRYLLNVNGDLLDAELIDGKWQLKSSDESEMENDLSGGGGGGGY